MGRLHKKSAQNYGRDGMVAYGAQEEGRSTPWVSKVFMTQGHTGYCGLIRGPHMEKIQGGIEVTGKGGEDVSSYRMTLRKREDTVN